MSTPITPTSNDLRRTAVRVTAQDFSELEMAQARENIGATPSLFAPYIDVVRDHDAVADADPDTPGSGTDNTEAIRDAFLSAQLSGFTRTVYFPPGDIITGEVRYGYRTTEEITVPLHVQIVGSAFGGTGAFPAGHYSGEPQSFLLPDEGTFHALYIPAIKGQTVKNFGIVGTGKATSTGAGIRLGDNVGFGYPGSGFRIEQVFIQGFGKGFWNIGVPDVTIADSRLVESGTDIYIQGADGGAPTHGQVILNCSTGGGFTGSTIFHFESSSVNVIGGNHNYADYLANCISSIVHFSGGNSEQIFGDYRIRNESSQIHLNSFRSLADGNEDSVLCRRIDAQAKLFITGGDIEVAAIDGFSNVGVYLEQDMAIPFNGGLAINSSNRGLVAYYEDDTFAAVNRYEMVDNFESGRPNTIEWVDDFLSEPHAASSIYGEKGWLKYAISGGMGASVIGAQGPNHIGIRQLNTDSADGSTCVFMPSDNGDGTGIPKLFQQLGTTGGGRLDWGFDVFFMPQRTTTPPRAETAFRIGLLETAAMLPSNTVCLRYDTETAGDTVMQFEVRTGGTSVVQSVGVGPTDDWHHLYVRQYEAGKTVFTLLLPDGSYVQKVVTSAVSTGYLNPGFAMATYVAAGSLYISWLDRFRVFVR